MKIFKTVYGALLTALVSAPLVLTAADGKAVALSKVATMPVKEVTVFKDGHAFVLHEGRMTTDASGNVVLDNLPTRSSARSGRTPPTRKRRSRP